MHMVIHNNNDIVIVTCSRKNYRWEFFINTEYLAWIDGSVWTPSTMVQIRNIVYKWSYDHFYALR